MTQWNIFKVGDIISINNILGFFVVNQKIKSLNEYINACRRNKYAGAKMKADTEKVIEFEIQNALLKGTLKPVKKPCKVKFEFHEKTAKRDVDNISGFGHKTILDAMQNKGIIANDNQRYITGLIDEFIRDEKDFIGVKRENPRF